MLAQVGGEEGTHEGGGKWPQMGGLEPKPRKESLGLGDGAAEGL